MGKMLRDYEVYLVHVDSERCGSCGEGVIECGKWTVEGGKGKPYDGERERDLLR